MPFRDKRPILSLIYKYVVYQITGFQLFEVKKSTSIYFIRENLMDADGQWDFKNSTLLGFLNLT